MQLTIHRGTRTIGGSCIEVASAGHRIILDLGLPLMGRDGIELDEEHLKARSVESGVLPNVSGLYSHQPRSIDAVFLSHAHIDHHGLLDSVHPEIPIYLSKGAQVLIEIGNIFYPEKTVLQNTKHFEFWKPFEIGPFLITPYLMDHSAFDAGAFLIECEGKKLFYTGDFRGHGGKAKVFENLVKYPIRDLDFLIMEGTTLGGDHGKRIDEGTVREALEQVFKTQTDISFVHTSGSNVDRLVSLYKACLKSKRTLVIDLYTAYVLDQLKTLRPSLPPHVHDNIRIFYIKGHGQRLVENGLEHILSKFYPRKINREEIVGRREDMVVKLPVSGMQRIARSLFEKGPLHDAQFIYSMWPGYLEKKPDVYNFCSKYDMEMKFIHTSGHAYLKDLQRLVHALNPTKVIPIHTLAGDSFGNHFPNVVRLDDGMVYDLN